MDGNSPVLYSGIISAAWSKAWNVFARSNIEILDSCPTQGTGFRLRLFSFVFGSGLAMG
jgi:hypothetical protein